MKRRRLLFISAAILALGLSCWILSSGTPPRPAQVAESDWTGEFIGNISNNMNLTTMQIESDEKLTEVHAGAVRHLKSQYPELDIAPNRHYWFGQTPDGYSLGYRMREGAPKHICSTNAVPRS